MTPQDFKELYTREIDNLHKEISAFTEERKLWTISGEIKNSPGNLCVHLIGNVNHFIGAVIGKNGYVRNRDAEFSAKNISKQKLLEDIASAKTVVEEVLGRVDAGEMQKDFPVELFGKKSTEYMLSFFLAHFTYHLGQINYFRRLAQ